MPTETQQTLAEFVIENKPEMLPIFTQLEAAAKIIASKLRKAGLEDTLGLTGERNAYGEEVQKLDDFANSLFVEMITSSNQVKRIFSEELEKPVEVNQKGEYIFAMDPMDGSSNIDVNLSLGSIFSVYKDNGELFQPGKNQIAAGYIIYSTCTMIVLTLGQGVFGFTLDPEVDSFFLTNSNLRMPEESLQYSLNEGIDQKFLQGVKEYLKHMKGKGEAKVRYAASMVGDIHRFLIKGGIFLYPQDSDREDGKLRLLYEVAPMSMLVEQAGGLAYSPINPHPLDVIPTKHDQKLPIVLGSKKNVEEFIKIHENHHPKNAS